MTEDERIVKGYIKVKLPFLTDEQLSEVYPLFIKTAFQAKQAVESAGRSRLGEETLMLARKHIGKNDQATMLKVREYFVSLGNDNPLTGKDAISIFSMYAEAVMLYAEHLRRDSEKQ